MIELAEKNRVVKPLYGGTKELCVLLNMGKKFSLEVFWRFRDELDIKNGGFVHYPKDGRGKYNFNLEKMEKWIHENEKRIFEK